MFQSLRSPGTDREAGPRCTEVENGARNVDHILTRRLLPEISREFLARMPAGDSQPRKTERATVKPTYLLVLEQERCKPISDVERKWIGNRWDRYASSMRVKQRRK